MSEFWDKVNAGYAAAGGEVRPEVWSDYRPPRQAKPKAAAKPRPPRPRPPVQSAGERGPQRILSPDQAAQILKEYEAGDSCPVLAERHHVSTGTIRLSILRCGGQMRTKKQAAVLSKTELSAETKTAMAELYRSGKGLYAVRDQFKIGVLRLLDVLEEQGIAVRRDGTQRKRTPDQEQEIRRVYETGLSIRAVGIQFGIPTTSTRESILRAGGTIRNSKFANRNKRTGSISE